ncbi:MAG: hypothetical protein SOW78_06410 [Clostridia bacterium]|nr:hypothetical protein [Clostridia bacterium]
MSDRINACCENRNTCGDDVCIQTRKVYDSCRDKECIENMRVYLTESGQSLVDRSVNVRCRKAEIIWIYSDVEPVAFNRGYYAVDLRFYFRITIDVFTGLGRPTQVEGIATYDKKVILFGSEGNAKIFTSKYKYDGADVNFWQKNNLPIAKIEVVDPIALGAKVVEDDDKCCCCCGEMDVSSVPEDICRVFDDIIVDNSESKKLYVTIGLFTIVRLERDVEIIVPVIDYCIPRNDCIQSAESNPCELFDKIKFPVDEFFPPEKCEFDPLSNLNNRGCGCDN